MTTLTIPQGTTRTIDVTDIVDKDGTPLNVSSWSVHAVARNLGIAGDIVAEWVTGDPGVSQNQAVASGTTVTLSIPAAVSSAWTWDTALLQVEITEPGFSRVERIATATLILDHEVVL